jgi:hypothetical protein
MQTFFCDCGNRLFFENVQCVACGREVGWCEGCCKIASFEPEDDLQYGCCHCGHTLVKCLNYSLEQVCNRFRLPTEAPDICSVCQLTKTIPDLSIEGNREKWQRLEQAKRRLIYQLDLLKLPYRDVSPPLSFDFKANVAPAEAVYRKGEHAEHVYTGHVDGKITINIQEADDVEREKLRVDMNEAHRTLIGHFRHEIGHYYWQVFVQGRDEDRCITLFGNHNAPDYPSALAAYYQQGPAPDWNARFISAYASAHPWEDFAETFALYLDIRSILETAKHLKMPLPSIIESENFSEYVYAYQQLGIIVNELNRCMGILDLVPEVIAPPVVDKLDYIHELVAITNSPGLRPVQATA